MKLTRKQRELLDCVSFLLEKNGHYPTLKEIADCMGLKSVSTVHEHIKKLNEKGVDVFSVASRDEPETKMVSIPLFGYVTAGEPVTVYEFEENVEVPASIVTTPMKTYALKIRGDSMIDEHICDGDIVIVEKRDTAYNGDIVIALVDGHETTVKKFRKRGKKVELIPANKEMKPMVFDENRVRIQGVVIGVVRKY
ncbi:repressor LexA [Thermotomaculum hydrothermale]|uniref:LexA repressor n=1 Tax=Thermotomaculum hydrothermale TaxID=981385 RepID=A0A7R6PG71_9BACT|nr:transcriptional repressor LexA [Thermotomaculum hydrothermale]BBB32004.1 repressor LexA [Thermotomaculum hydrothermale]